LHRSTRHPTRRAVSLQGSEAVGHCAPARQRAGRASLLAGFIAPMLPTSRGDEDDHPTVAREPARRASQEPGAVSPPCTAAGITDPRHRQLRDRPSTHAKHRERKGARQVRRGRVAGAVRTATTEADRTAQLQTALNGKHSAQRPAPRTCISHGTVPIATGHLET
jgi:hypothetical protein